MHCQREVSSPQEQGEGSHPQSDGITEVVRVDLIQFPPEMDEN